MLCTCRTHIYTVCVPRLLYTVRWENPKGLCASDRRILLANWFYNASVKALEGEAKRKYFEHAGALLTADGTDDDQIKLEGVPKGVKFSF